MGKAGVHTQKTPRRTLGPPVRFCASVLLPEESEIIVVMQQATTPPHSPRTVSHYHFQVSWGSVGGQLGRLDTPEFHP